MALSISDSQRVQVTKLTAALIGNTQVLMIGKKIWRSILENKLDSSAKLAAERFEIYKKLAPQLTHMCVRVPYILLLNATTKLMEPGLPAVIQLMRSDGADVDKLMDFLPSFVLEHTLLLLEATKEDDLKNS